MAQVAGAQWCPPGHGDLYQAMLGSGTLDKLLAKGYKYMFVSNSDNLGATMDLKLLTWFAASGAPFAMEVAARTEADKKGGHLCQRSFGGGLLLRESAQCPDADEKKFQDTSKHKFFNTNNLWIDLVALKAAFDKFGGVLPLPVIKNQDGRPARQGEPEGAAARDGDGTWARLGALGTAPYFQLTPAPPLGRGDRVFDGAQAILIPRTRWRR